VLFSVEVIGEKVPLVPKIQVFLGGFKYFLFGFAILLGLLIKILGLGAEFTVESYGSIVNGDCL